MRIALAQCNPTIGDFEGNIRKIEDTIQRLSSNVPDLIVFSEMFLTGYPPKDYLERPDFIQASENALQEVLHLSSRFPHTGFLIGTVRPTGSPTGNPLYNSAVLIQNGTLLFEQHKTLLPTYDVFDEFRYFAPSPHIQPFAFKGEKLGITICEDMWTESELWPEKTYVIDPVEKLAKQGATVLINLSSSPFYVGKEKIRYQLLQKHAQKHRLPFLMVNQVGGNDELIFDGRSMAVNARGALILHFPPFKEHIAIVDLNALPDPFVFEPMENVSAMYQALILGLQDYMRKCGFQKVVLGLSGGIDSSLVACLACEAIGPENVLGISMPSQFSSKASIEDAEILAKNLGIAFQIIPIDPIVKAYHDTLAKAFQGTPPGIAEENIQARIRGNILMAFSNKFGSLLLSTGNKSELAMGYCTLYGDLSGGLSVIGDVPKTDVYRLAQYANRKKEYIPQRCFTKAPSAELRPNQTDQDTLPPYDMLDAILDLYLEKELSRNAILEKGFAPETVDFVIRTLHKNEYKRRQAPPVLKLFPKSFGTGRRMPIAARFPI